MGLGWVMYNPATPTPINFLKKKHAFWYVVVQNPERAICTFANLEAQVLLTELLFSVILHWCPD